MIEIVNISDMKVCQETNDVIVTYALGSCIGLTIYDPVAKIGGILHYMLPDSNLDPSKAKKNPCMFADTGISLLFEEARNLGGEISRLKIVLAGGAQIMNQKGLFNIGERNDKAARKLLEKIDVNIHFKDTGGNANRTVRLELDTGNILIKDGVREKGKMI